MGRSGVGGDGDGAADGVSWGGGVGQTGLGAVRRPGGGRKPQVVKDAGLSSALIGLVAPDTAVKGRMGEEVSNMASNTGKRSFQVFDPLPKTLRAGEPDAAVKLFGK